jgi:hypothetical protein
VFGATSVPASRATARPPGEAGAGAAPDDRPLVTEPGARAGAGKRRSPLVAAAPGLAKRRPPSTDLGADAGVPVRGTANRPAERIGAELRATAKRVSGARSRTTKVLWMR